MPKELLNLPDELLLYINSMLSFEDRVALGQSSRRLRYITGNHCGYNAYDIMQICDDPKETFLVDSSGRKPKLSFLLHNAPKVLSYTSNVQEIVIMMKEVDMSSPSVMPKTTPYTEGGYLGPLLGSAKLRNKMKNLKRVCLHVDMMIDTIAHKQVFAPFQDLQVAFEKLAFQPFETYVQFSLCCSQFTEQDGDARDFLVKSMQDLLKLLNQYGAKSNFDPSPIDGYVDMNVEYGKLEYNFSFFYYNPEICDTAIDEGET